MAESTQPGLENSSAASASGRSGLACGLVLFAYLVSHFVNHALGNISMDALAAGVYFHTLFWQCPPVRMAFYAASVTHTGLGIWALYERRTVRWKAIEPLQLVLG